MNEGCDVTQQVSYVHITVTQNAREKNLLEHQRINRSCLTLIGDVLRTLTFRFPSMSGAILEISKRVGVIPTTLHLDTLF